MDQLEANPSDLVSRFAYAVKPQEEFKDGRLTEGQYAAYVLDYAYTGFIKFEVEAETDCVLDIIFDEVDLRGEKKPGEPANIAYWRNSPPTSSITLAKGTHAHLSFNLHGEVHRHRKAPSKSKSFPGQIRKPDVAFSLTCEDKRFEDIAKAAIRAFKHKPLMCSPIAHHEKEQGGSATALHGTNGKTPTGLNKVKPFLEKYACIPRHCQIS